MTVGPSADGKGSRTVTVEPLASEAKLRNADWVGEEPAPGAGGGHRRARGLRLRCPTRRNWKPRLLLKPFYFFPQCDEEAIIVDEGRFNGGGDVADYYIDLLRRPFTTPCGPRATATTSGRRSFAVFGPKAMLIDETAGSGGGDLLHPGCFRQNKLGTLVGNAHLGRSWWASWATRS